MERDYPPLSASCVKNLVDKLCEKRNLATLEIERITNEAYHQEKRGDIVKLIGYFSQDFITSPNHHIRRGGLLGLASVAIGLNQNVGSYYKSILSPVIRTFHDNDFRVRYYACETLYNIMKVTRTDTLNLLSEVFDAVSRGVSDPDSSVRQGAVQCDRLLKEIVTEPDCINLSVMVSLLRERMYTNNPYARQFIVSWATALYAVPGLKISTYLPQLLDGLFRILGDPNQDIRRQCEILLSDLLAEIVANSKDVVFDNMINSLIVHCRLSSTACAVKDNATGPSSPPGSVYSTGHSSSSAALIMDTSNQSASIIHSSTGPSTTPWTGLASSAEQLQQRTALNWIRAFVELDAEHMLPFASGIIGAVLPCFLMHGSSESACDRRATLDTVVRINETLLNSIINYRADNTTDTSSPRHRMPVPQSDSDPFAEIPTSENPIRAVHTTRDMTQPPAQSDRITSRVQPICTDAILDASCRLLDHQGLLTRLAALRWIEVLGKVRPKEVLSHLVRLLPLLLKLLADTSSDMVHSVIRLIGNLCNHPDAIDLLDELSLSEWHLPDSLFSVTSSHASQQSHATVGNSNTNIANTKVTKTTTTAYQLFRMCHTRRSPESSDKSHTPDADATADSCNIFCVRFLVDLVQFFDQNTQLLSQRGDMIITDLCHVLGADVIYHTLSVIIAHMTALRSASVLVQALNRILLTQPGLHEFRNQLRAVHDEDGCRLLERLYRAWCHNPVALLSLYMLTQNYKQGNRLIKSFGEISITVDMLIEMDQLVQMIESPIFALLRMHLLDKRFSADLRETLYCLLMCLPQTDVFQILWRRLQCIPPVANLSDWQVGSGHPQPDFRLIDFEDLFSYFHQIQTQYTHLRIQDCALSSSKSDSTTMGNENANNAVHNTNNGGPSYDPSSTRVKAQASSSFNETISPVIQRAKIAADENRERPLVGSASDHLAQSLAKLGIHVPELSSSTHAPSII